jgi:UDP-sugar transporter A1/2/3
VTLALQNATLSLVMHYSRVSASADEMYSAASAVLLNEIFKGSISFALSIYFGHGALLSRIRGSTKEVFSPDCIKLSLPAILYGKPSQHSLIGSD